MDNFTCEYVSGTVVSSQKHTQTHVYSEGGGGRITAGRNIVGDPVLRGKIEAPTMKSYTSTTHEIFLQLENGQELSLAFPYDDIALREGHFITLLPMFRVGVADGYYARLFNHHTRSSNSLLTNLQWRKLTSPFLQKLSAAKELPQKAEPTPTSHGSFLDKIVAYGRKSMDDMAKGWSYGSPEAVYAYQNRDTDAPLSQFELNQPLALEFAQVLDEAMRRLQQA
jgi:hypothetical protein